MLTILAISYLAVTVLFYLGVAVFAPNVEEANPKIAARRHYVA